MKTVKSSSVLFLMTLLLPWSNSLTTILLVPLALCFVIEILNNGFNKKNFIFIFAIGSVFFVNFIFGFFNDNISIHFKESISHAPLLMIPLFILGARKKSLKQPINKLLIVFAFSFIVMASSNYVSAFFRILTSDADILQSLGAIKYDILSRGLINHHQLYFGLFLSFALNILFYYFFSPSRPKEVNRIFIGIAFFIGFYFLIILSVRMSLAATVLALTIQVFSLKFSFILKVFTILCITFVLIIGYQYNTTLQKRINYLNQFSLDYNYNEDWAYEGLALRFMNWECSLNVGLDNIYTGVGISNAQKHLDNCYSEKKFDSILFFTKTNGSVYNSHNMYLQSFVSSGIFGLLICMFMAIGLLAYSIKKRDKLFLIFLLLFFTQGLTESLLYREKGIYFFALFSSVFLLRYNFKNS